MVTRIYLNGLLREERSLYRDLRRMGATSGEASQAIFLMVLARGGRAEVGLNRRQFTSGAKLVLGDLA